jgi:hypothetical protein
MKILQHQSNGKSSENISHKKRQWKMSRKNINSFTLSRIFDNIQVLKTKIPRKITDTQISKEIS